MRVLYERVVGFRVACLGRYSGDGYTFRNSPESEFRSETRQEFRYAAVPKVLATFATVESGT